MLSFQKFFWFNSQKYYICTDTCMSYVEYCMHTSKAHFCTPPHNTQFDWTIISISQTPATTQTTYPIHQTTAHYIPSIQQHHQIINLIHTTKNKSDPIEITTSKTTKTNKHNSNLIDLNNPPHLSPIHSCLSNIINKSDPDTTATIT